MLVKYQIQVRYRPSILDNLKHWQIFDDDEELKSFLQVIDEFLALQIEEEQLDNNESNRENQTSHFHSRIGHHNIIQLSNIFIPKGFCWASVLTCFISPFTRNHSFFCLA